MLANKQLRYINRRWLPFSMDKEKIKINLPFFSIEPKQFAYNMKNIAEDRKKKAGFKIQIIRSFQEDQTPVAVVNTSSKDCE